MSRQVSAAIARNPNHALPRDIPRPGSRTRAIYDALIAQPGRLIEMPFSASSLNGILTHLRDDYGLDIRCRGSGRGTCLWLLAGEYIGAGYLDYIANPELASRTNP